MLLTGSIKYTQMEDWWKWSAHTRAGAGWVSRARTVREGSILATV